MTASAFQNHNLFRKTDIYKHNASRKVIKSSISENLINRDTNTVQWGKKFMGGWVGK